MKSAVIAAAAALALAALAPAAHAQHYAITAQAVNLRAGPARDYPIVAVLGPGVQVLVFGCLSDYRWCDVAEGPYRGWVYAGNLDYAFRNGYAPLPSVGTVAGIVALTFILDDYWSTHYRDRRFYAERDRWVRPPPRVIRRPSAPGIAPAQPYSAPPPAPPARVQPFPRAQRPLPSVRPVPPPAH
jgi:uncharacterized protein YraI